MSNNKVDIGVLVEKPNWLFHPRFFPSKVGGKPAWLNLRDLPLKDELTCQNCKDPLIFLCQVYAPYEELEECFHRTILLFICRNGSCCLTNTSDNFLVLRCQLQRTNEFYSFEPYDENENEDFPIDIWTKLCEICGCKAPSHCSKCKKVFYCGRKHQILDWQKGHKECCPSLQGIENVQLNNFKVTEAGKSLLFKEWELIVEEEDEEDPKSTDENQEIEKLKKMMLDKKAGTLNNISADELELYTGKIPEDKVFNKFTKRVSRHPDQVLRYDRGGQPLWITGKTDTIIQIPKCQYCGSDREFEFQIMPQLLNYIDVGLDFNSIDWGVLVVYTCKSSCNAGPAYKLEHLIKQDLSN